MIRIALCDDEVTTLNHIQSLLLQYTMPLSIDVFTSGEALITAYRQQVNEDTQNPNGDSIYHILILDIDMEGMSGIETAKKIREWDKQVQLIYATNYSDYTTFAFGVHAFAYLLKPLTKEMLFQQLDEALAYLRVVPKTLLTFQTTEGIVRIPVDQIYYFEYLNRIEALSRCVKMHTDQHQYYIKQRLTDAIDKLASKDFAMPHKSFYVNLRAVKAIHGYEIILVNDTVIPLSQKKSQAFRQALNQYLSCGGELL